MSDNASNSNIKVGNKVRRRTSGDRTRPELVDSDGRELWFFAGKPHRDGGSPAFIDPRALADAGVELMKRLRDLALDQGRSPSDGNGESRENMTPSETQTRLAELLPWGWRSEKPPDRGLRCKAAAIQRLPNLKSVVLIEAFTSQSSMRGFQLLPVAGSYRPPPRRLCPQAMIWSKTGSRDLPLSVRLYV